MKYLLFSSFLFFFLLGCLSAQTVYITKTGKKYHSSDCSSLSRISIPIEFKEAQDKGYTPSNRCSPTTIVSTSNLHKVSLQNTDTQTSKTTIPSSGQCQAIAKKGAQCKRKAHPGSNYCRQHSR